MGAFLAHTVASLSEALLQLNTPVILAILWSVRYRTPVHEPQAMTASRLGCGVHRDQQPPDAHYDARLI
jgi:hypothetical protein